MKPSIISGRLNNPYNKPTGQPARWFIIVAMPVTPPGAMLAGAMKQCRPSEKTDDAKIMIKKSSAQSLNAALFLPFTLGFFFLGIINHLEQFFGAFCFADK